MSDIPKGYKLLPPAGDVPQGYKVLPDSAASAPAQPRSVPDKSLQPSYAKPARQSGIGDSLKGMVDWTRENIAVPAGRAIAPYAIAGTAGTALTGGNPLGGAAAITAGGIYDLAASLYNLGVVPASNAIHGPGYAKPIPTMKDVTDSLLTKIGIEKTKGGVGRMVEAAVGGAASGGMGNFAAKMVAPVVAQSGAKLAPLVSSMAQGGVFGSTASGLTSGAGAQGAAELGGGPGLQMLAALGAPMVPGVAGKAFRGAVGLSDPKSIPRARERMAVAERVGVQPDLAYTLPSAFTRSIQRVTGSTPSGEAAKARRVEALDTKVKQVIESYGAKPVNTDAMGYKLQKALGNDPGAFVANSRKVEGAIWDDWFNRVEQFKTAHGGGDPDLSNTIGYLKKNLAPHEGAESTSSTLASPALKRVWNALSADLAPAGDTILGPGGKPLAIMQGKTTIPLRTVRELRSRIGEMLDNPNLPASESKSKLKGLYASLTRDMEAHAKKVDASIPGTFEAFQRANRATRGLMSRVDKYIGPLQKKVPTEVWDYAANPSAVQNGGHKFLSINRSLDPETRKVFHSTFLNELGKSPTGEFDPAVFADKYKALSPMVKSAIFSDNAGGGPRVASARQKAIEDVVSTIDFMRQSKSIGPTPNTQENVGAYMVLSALMHHTAGSIGRLLAAHYKLDDLSKLTSNPDFIKRLVNENRLPPTAAARAVYAFTAAYKAKKAQEDGIEAERKAYDDAFRALGVQYPDQQGGL